MLTGGVNVMPLELTDWVGYALAFVSAVVLPYVAGGRFKRAGYKKATAIFGAVSISGVTVLVVGAIFFLEGTEVEAFYGFVIATLMFGVPFQAGAGYYGWRESKGSDEEAT